MCRIQFLDKSNLENHIIKEHGKVQDFNCDKSEFIAVSDVELESHRKTAYYFFMYYCGACNFDTTKMEILKKHKQTKHERIITETLRYKVAPLPKCNLNNMSHTSECCDRDPKKKRPKIYSHEERNTNGFCLDWNKGFCPNFELCKYRHEEIEACRYANFCNRPNCRFWHNSFGRFPFLENTRQQNMHVNW